MPKYIRKIQDARTLVKTLWTHESNRNCVFIPSHKLFLFLLLFFVFLTNAHSFSHELNFPTIMVCYSPVHEGKIDKPPSEELYTHHKNPRSMLICFQNLSRPRHVNIYSPSFIFRDDFYSFLKSTELSESRNNCTTCIFLIFSSWKIKFG